MINVGIGYFIDGHNRKQHLLEGAMLVFTDVLIYGSHGLIFQSMQVNTEN
jgi:hypothetical protein